MLKGTWSIPEKVTVGSNYGGQDLGGGALKNWDPDPGRRCQMARAGIS